MDGEAGGVVGSGKVVVGVGLLLLLPEDPGELLDREDLALVGDGVDRVLVRVRRLEQSALQTSHFMIVILPTRAQPD